MGVLRTALARVRALWRRDVIADEINDELQFHLEMRAQEHERRGLAREAAVRAATKRFGNLATLRDQGYDVRGGGLLETILQDVRYAWLLLNRRRIYSGAAILTLALGIGLSTTLISIVDAAWLRPLPFPDPDRLVQVHLAVEYPDGSGTGDSSPSLQDIRALRDSAQALDSIGQWHQWEERQILDRGEPERAKVLRMSEGYADVYGVPPALGRTFVVDDTRPGAPPVAILGHAFWRRRFAGDPSIVGQTFLLDNVARTVVGVLAPSLHRDTQVWVPQTEARLVAHRDSGADVYARVRSGVSLQEAEQALGQVARSWPTPARGSRVTGVRLKPLYVDVLAASRDVMSVVVVSVLVLVALVCVNVTGLVMADGLERRREFAVRASMGAGRSRLARQMLTEAGVLGAIASVLGMLVAWVSLDALVNVLPLNLPPHAAPSINGRVLAFALGAAACTITAVALWPAWRMSRASLVETMTGAAQRRTRPWPRAFGRGLVVVEVALAVILLTGGGLLVRSLDRLLAVDLGFQPEAILTLEAVPVDQSPATWQQYFPQLLARLRTVPGVAAAGAIDGMPLAGAVTMFAAAFEGSALDDVTIAGVTPGYLEALGVRVIEGRTFSSQDAGQNAAVIDATLARRLFPNGGAVGQTVKLDVPMTVIGVVSDVRDSARTRGTVVYTWLVPHAFMPPTIVIRAEPGVSLSHEALRTAALGVGIRSFVERIKPGSELLDDSVAAPRNLTALLTLLACLGLLLTLIGTAGVTAYAVARRTQEVGIRMAFGATPGNVVAGMTFEALRPIVAGLVIGLVASYFATAVLERFLFQTPPTDPTTFAAVAVGLGVAALIAAWLPARRAAHVDPVQALRAE